MTEQPVFPCGQNDLAASSRCALTRHRFTIASMVDRYGKPLCSNPLTHLIGEVAHCRLRGVFAKQRGVVGRESAINECLEPKVRSADFHTIGLALHETLLICGCCGRALTVRYLGNGGLYPLCLCSARRREGLATTDCLSMSSDLLNNAIGEAGFTALRPAELKLAVTALNELEQRDHGIMRQWHMLVERAEY
ncbi:zinc ribbon domain-containing protein [Paraburkholderia youngii]|uniref:zinc ribbon domain-containing protein n=1 Tax=Paraburkholderia youngii TaxID=2782701 RepID=UPI003D2285D1